MYVSHHNNAKKMWVPNFDIDFEVILSSGFQMMASTNPSSILLDFFLNTFYDNCNTTHTLYFYSMETNVFIISNLFGKEKYAAVSFCESLEKLLQAYRMFTEIKQIYTGLV